jgi:ABC-type enterochelin transport system permease subunit
VMEISLQIYMIVNAQKKKDAWRIRKFTKLHNSILVGLANLVSRVVFRKFCDMRILIWPGIPEFVRVFVGSLKRVDFICFLCCFVGSVFVQGFFFFFERTV